MRARRFYGGGRVVALLRKKPATASTTTAAMADPFAGPPPPHNMTCHVHMADFDAVAGAIGRRILARRASRLSGAGCTWPTPSRRIVWFTNSVGDGATCRPRTGLNRSQLVFHRLLHRCQPVKVNWEDDRLGRCDLAFRICRTTTGLGRRSARYGEDDTAATLEWLDDFARSMLAPWMSVWAIIDAKLLFAQILHHP